MKIEDFDHARLRPCPFCGEAPMITRDDEIGKYFIQCSGLESESQCEFTVFGGPFEEIEDAVRAHGIIEPDGMVMHARFAADFKGNTTFEGEGGVNDPSLMQDLPAPEKTEAEQ